MTSPRATAPALGAAPALHLPPQQRHWLSNGLEVIVVEQRVLPVLDVRFFARGGAAAHGPDRGGLAWLTAELLDQGTRTRTASQVADQAELLGASLQSRASWDTIAAGLHVLSPRMMPALELLADIITSPVFPDAELERKRDERLAAILQEMDDPRALASMAFTAAVYGSEHPYGVPVAGTRQSVQALERSAVLDFHARTMTPGRSFLVLAGDVDTGSVLPALEQMFGGWTGDAGARSAALSAPRQETGIQVVDRPGAPQSELRIGLPGPPRSTGDHFALLVANTVLGGSFTSRLNIRLRQEKGYTYGAGSSFSFRTGGGPFVASTAVHTAATADAVDTIHAEIARLAARPVPAAELDRAQNYIVLGLPRTFETTADLAEHVAEVALHGLGDEYYDHFADRVRAVTADEVLDVAARWLRPDELTTMIAGDAAVISRDLEALGRGAVHVRTNG
jgi:zinc protease